MAQDDLTDAERRLLAAVLLAACEDASKGYPSAREWLAVEGSQWAEALEICAYDVVETWAYHPGPVPRRSDFNK